MSKELKSIPENESTNDQSKSSKPFPEHLLQTMSVLNPILHFDSDSPSSSNTGQNISMKDKWAEDSFENGQSTSLMNDSFEEGEKTPTPKCMESMDIEKLRTSLQLNKKNSSQRKTVSMLIQEQSPSFLVIESLVWLICSALEKDSYRKKQMFNALCESMTSFNVLGLSYLEESLQPIRDSIAHKFNLEIRRVQHYLNNGVAVNDNPSPYQALTFNSDQIHISSNTGLYGSNRFHEEFDEIEVISQGGFGVIKKSRYKLDNCIYAVKEIAFPYREHNNFLQIIREVKLYANLEPHPNVISYKTAWIQNCSIDEQIRKNRTRSFTKADIVEVTSSSNSASSDETRTSSEDGSVVTEADLTSRTNASAMGSYDDDDIVSFRSGLSNDDENCDSLNKSFSQMQTCEEYSTYTSYSEESKLAITAFNPNRRQSKVTFNAVLYIQMELCGIDLRKYLDSRNRKIELEDVADPFEKIDVKAECEHFLQILKGVEYIHSKQMIHRDLKPQNILFSLDNLRIKIGDFGLATLHSSTNFQPTKSTGGFVGHTRSLGTEVYAAPEQRSSYDYDYRVDMYSLGLILFELFHPVFTNMERGKVIDNLKSKRIISPEMNSHWPKLCSLILKLTSKNPDDRPNNISDVTLLFREAFANILLLKPNLTRKEIEILIQENLQLKMKLAEKDEQIEKLKQVCDKCSVCSGTV